VLSEETANNNLIVFGLTGPGLEPMIYHTGGEHVTITPQTQFNQSGADFTILLFSIILEIDIAYLTFYPTATSVIVTLEPV
jgi:hypothetical protein